MKPCCTVQQAAGESCIGRQLLWSMVDLKQRWLHVQPSRGSKDR